MSLLRSVLLRAAASPSLRRQLTSRQLSRSIALRFVAGETLDDGLTAARALARAGKTITLDYLGEAVTREHEARAAAAVYRQALARIGEEGLAAGVSVKPTQMGLRLSQALCAELLGEVVAAAESVDAHVTLDMEGSDVTEATIRLVERLRVAGYREVGCAVQAYLRRTRDDVERLTAAGASLRLCKGAYAEPPEIAYTSRAEVDASFAELAEWLLVHGVYPRIATHDDGLIDRVRTIVARGGIGRDTFEFQMLHGIRPSLQDRLVRDGWPLRVYVPFGYEWYPYFMRRIAERPANLGFFLRSLRDT